MSYDPTTPEAKARFREMSRQGLIGMLPDVPVEKIDQLLDDVEQIALEVFGKEPT
jgi:hypothetical protein